LISVEDDGGLMRAKTQTQWDLFLLLFLLLLISMYPILDHGDIGRIILALAVLVLIILTTARMSQIKARVWPSVVLLAGAVISGVADRIHPNRMVAGIRWGILAAFFALSVYALFNYLKNSRSVRNPQLYTAVSIYLLLGLLWFALYCAINEFQPGSFLHSSSGLTDSQTDLLYFSLVTLSTIGYGDIVPVHGEVRMLAAMEGITGVLYIATTVAFLVSAYKQPDNSS
jgi:hypothetical protein